MIQFSTLTESALLSGEIDQSSLIELRRMVCTAKGDDHVVTFAEYQANKHLLASDRAISFAERIFSEQRKVAFLDHALSCLNHDTTTTVQNCKFESTNPVCLVKDTDEDGMVDARDLCPSKAGPHSNLGCPLPLDQNTLEMVEKPVNADNCPEWLVGCKEALK